MNNLVLLLTLSESNLYRLEPPTNPPTMDAKVSVSALFKLAVSYTAITGSSAYLEKQIDRNHRRDIPRTIDSRVITPQFLEEYHVLNPKVP